MKTLKLSFLVRKIIISTVAIVFILNTPLLILSQECTNNAPMGMPTPRSTWKQNTKVTVSIDPSQFNATEIACMAEVFGAWNANNESIGTPNGVNNNASGVTFAILVSQGSSSQIYATPSTATSPAQITSSSQPTSSNPLYQINRTAPGIDHDYAETTISADTGQATGGIALAVTNIDPGITNCQALKEAMSHDIGHTFKLAHCSPSTPCVDANGNPTSTMVQGPPCTGPINQDTERPSCTATDLNRTGINPVGPTPCDNRKVRIIPPAYDPNTVATPTPPEEGGGGDGGGGGGGPYDDPNDPIDDDQACYLRTTRELTEGGIEGGYIPAVIDPYTNETITEEQRWDTIPPTYEDVTELVCPIPDGL